MKMRTRSALLVFYHSYFKSSTSFLCRFSSLSSLAKTTDSDSALVDCLTITYKFTKTQAISISNRFSSVKDPIKPKTVHKFFRELGFSETQIRTVVLVSPQILFSSVDKTLKPKVEFLNKQLGMESSDLCKFISKSPMLLKRSLKENLGPSFEILKEKFGSDANSQHFIRLLQIDRWAWTTPKTLLANCDFLESCGIVGPQLFLMLKTCPRVIFLKESTLRNHVSTALDMGFPLDSRMFGYALRILSCLNKETFEKKMELLGSYGFSESECMEMFRRAPMMAGVSEEKLKFGIYYFLNTVGFKKSLLIRSPYLLMLGMKKRVIPRYKVFQVLKLKKLFKREPSFYTMLLIRESVFLEKYILRFEDDIEELLEAYNGHISGSSEEKES